MLEEQTDGRLRIRIVDWGFLIFLVALHLALRSLTIRAETDLFIGASPLLIGSLVAIYLSARGAKFYEMLATVCLATIISTAAWSFECVLRTTATKFLWNDFVFENYGTDPTIQFFQVLINTIVMTTVAALIGAIIYYFRGS